MLIAVIAIAVLLFLVLFFLWPGKRPKDVSAFTGRNYAHRGLHDGVFPENSLAAFDAAVQAGYGIELDIQLSSDGKVMVFHDDTLNRVCGVDGRVDERTAAELQSLPLCGTEQRIPAFTQVLSLVDGKVPLIVELKRGKNNSLLCAKAIELLSQYHGPYCIESFHPMIVGYFKKHAPHILRGQLSSPPSHLRSEIGGATAFMLGNLFTNVIARPQFVAYEIGKKGVPVRIVEGLGAMRVCWTARNEKTARELEAANDAVIFEKYTPRPKYR